MTPLSRLSGENIIIFSSDDWASGLKTSKYHIARDLARSNRVLFVNSVGLRAPAATGRDLGRVVKKLASFFSGVKRVPEGLHVYTPVVFPFRRGHPAVKTLNGAILRTALRWIKVRLSLREPIVFSFIPTFNDVIGTLGEKAIIYYCIDDLRGYAGVDGEWFDQEEDRLLSLANCVISSAKELDNAFRKKGHKSYYMPHGVDWALFRKAVTDDFPTPQDIRHIPKPRLGFYGFLSDEWVDYPLLKKMAKEHPDWQIVLIGRPKAGMNMDTVVPEDNIHFLGLRPFESLPAYTRHFDVGLIPFNLNQLTQNSNPLKLLEYLSGGLPVVSTDIPEVRQYAETIHVADSHDAFIAQCEKVLQQTDPEARERRSRIAEMHSWENRVEQISDIVLAEVTAKEQRTPK